MSKERDYMIESLSLLMDSGMDMFLALEALHEDARSKRARVVLGEVKTLVSEGASLSAALEKLGGFNQSALSLIKSGERVGRLAENLRVTALELQKDRAFRSKIASAMMYPSFVLVMSVLVGVGVAWFILPRLTSVFSSLDVELPIITRLLLAVGTFLGAYGTVAVPLFVVALLLICFFIFVYRRTKFIGQALLLALPGTRRLLEELELARMGYLLGTLLEAGLPIVEAVRVLAEASNLIPYKYLYNRLAALIEDGNSIEKSFALLPGVRRLIPVPVQQMISAGEHSGRLVETLKKIGAQYEARSDTTTKNLTVILEPILLVIVWLGVMFVALAVMLPIYQLIGGLH